MRTIEPPEGWQKLRRCGGYGFVFTTAVKSHDRVGRRYCLFGQALDMVLHQGMLFSSNEAADREFGAAHILLHIGAVDKLKRIIAEMQAPFDHPLYGMF